MQLSTYRRQVSKIQQLFYVLIKLHYKVRLEVSFTHTSYDFTESAACDRVFSSQGVLLTKSHSIGKDGDPGYFCCRSFSIHKMPMQILGQVTSQSQLFEERFTTPSHRKKKQELQSFKLTFIPRLCYLDPGFFYSCGKAETNSQIQHQIPNTILHMSNSLSLVFTDESQKSD